VERVTAVSGGDVSEVRGWSEAGTSQGRVERVAGHVDSVVVDGETRRVRVAGGQTVDERTSLTARH